MKMDNNGAMFRLGEYGVCIEMHDTFGKRPGLYVHSPGWGLKVGNFASEEKALIFEKYLRYMLRLGVEADELWNGFEDRSESIDNEGTGEDS